MNYLPLHGNTKHRRLLVIAVSIVLVTCSVQLIIAPSTAAPWSPGAPALDPVATIAFELPAPAEASDHLEVAPVRVGSSADLKDCAPDWVQEVVLAEATSDVREIKIDCHLILDSEDVVTKTLIFETSGVTVNCNFAQITGGDGTSDSANNVNYRKDMIEVRSPSSLVNGERIWERPRNINIRDCIVIGSIRVWGMGKNGQGKIYSGAEGDENIYRSSSREVGHTERARANAPTKIVFDNLTITGVGRNPVYFAPGVTFSKLINSEIKGESDAVALYLDAESYANTIKNNFIHVSTKNHLFERWDRPLIAIDGSSHNKILNNRFANLSHGGIYLYRNCGEGGVIRHSTPSYNQIVNNIFYYNRYRGSNPSVYLGSRDYGQLQETFGYCGDDGVSGTITEVSYGSGVSNKDHASHNLIMQNQIFKRSIGDMIRTKNTSVNSPNYIDFNRTVTSDTVIYNGLAGCYTTKEYKNFIEHGAVRDVYENGNNAPSCTSYQDTCNDGELIRTVEQINCGEYESRNRLKQK